MERKSVLITGANRGFGLALFKSFIAADWNVFPLVRSEQNAEFLKQMNPDRCFSVVSDVRYSEKMCYPNI